jgi:hypothetical protein
MSVFTKLRLIGSRSNLGVCMPSLLLDGRLIYFAHCPKAGGTSVERFMVDRWGDAVGMLGWGWDRKWRREGERAGEVPSSPQHYIWEDARRVLPRAPDHVFTVVRDPVARMVSEYRYQQAGRLTGPFGRPLRGLGFATWLRLMFAMAARNPYTHDNHFRPQTDFLPEGEVTVFRLEDGLGPVFAWLCGLAEIPAPEVPPHDLKAERGRPVVASEADKALIYRRFHADYARFGYAAPAGAEEAEAPPSALIRAAAPVFDRLYRRGLV